MTCTFFGNRNTPDAVAPKLEAALIDLIENRGVDRFYVGDCGAFDRMVCRCLRRLSQRYPGVTYRVVLAYMPTQKNDDFYSHEETIYPDGLETVPRRYAIARRNEWMISRADYVVTCVHQIGGAKQFRELSLRRGKTVIDLV